MVQSKKVISLMVLSLGIPGLFPEGLVQGASRWDAARGDGFEVITDAGANTAANMARHLGQMRELFGGSTKFLPLRVLLLSSEDLFSSLRPSGTAAGFYQSGADEDWIVVRWGRPDSHRAASHELIHAFMEHSGPRRPLWLEEGLAEFYSTAELDGKGWTIGRPIPEHVQVLNQQAWLGEREFFEAAHDSALREEGSRIGRFYSQSWAVVHYLLTTPGVREKTPDLFNALGDGLPFARACESVLGQRQGLVLEAARRAVERGRFLTARLAATPVPNGAPSLVALTPAETDAVLVRLGLAAGHPFLARTASAAPAQKGLLALARGDRAEAERLFNDAIAAGSPDAAPYFELAMLLRESQREPQRVAALLRDTLERNPNHAEAHFIRGLQAAANGDNESAVESFQNAARILPRQANFWHALALALERSGRLAEAAHAATRCRLAARNPAEREMAAALERLTRQPAPARPPAKPEVQVPESWQGLRGDASVEGQLVEFNCDATPPTARIKTAGEPLTLRIEKPDKIRILGTGAVRHTLNCGPQNLPVRVEYRRATNELAAIEFR